MDCRRLNLAWVGQLTAAGQRLDFAPKKWLVHIQSENSLGFAKRGRETEDFSALMKTSESTCSWRNRLNEVEIGAYQVESFAQNNENEI